jgi:hypothetical protein
MLGQSIINNVNVKRSSKCSGNYISENGFRISEDNSARNLVNDYKAFINDESMFEYYYVLAALHHASASNSVRDDRIIRQFNKITHDNSDNLFFSYHKAMCNIQRPLTDATLTLVYNNAMTKVTDISKLSSYQYNRIIAGSLASIIAINLSYYKINNSHYFNHNVIHRILRRVSGSINCVKKIAAPYTECASYIARNIPTDKHELIKSLMKEKFKPPFFFPESRVGPPVFHKAEYYARECLKLIGNPINLNTNKWYNLTKMVERVRRGELTPYQVIADPDNDYWVYQIHYTFFWALKNYIDAINRLLKNNLNRSTRDIMGTTRIKKNESKFWQYSEEIYINDSRDLQTKLISHAMFRFIIQASCVISNKFIGIFGLSPPLKKKIISRAKYLSTTDGNGSEAAALVFGHFMPCLMTPKVHLDICVTSNLFQNDRLYIRYSNPIFGELKKKFRDVIPARHNGIILRKK